MRITFENSKIITALLEELEEHFPNKIPINSSPSLEEIRRLQGHQEVIQYVRNLVDEDETKEEG